MTESIQPIDLLDSLADLWAKGRSAEDSVPSEDAPAEDEDDAIATWVEVETPMRLSSPDDYRKLSKEERTELFARARRSDRWAAQALVRANWGLIHKSVLKLHARHAYGDTPNEDLVQEGALGLIRAAQTYDSNKGEFSTYAVLWIRNRVVRAIQQQGVGVHIPQHLWDRSRSKIGDARIAAFVRMSRLDAPLSEDELNTQLNLLASDEDPTDERIERYQQRQILERAIGRLPAKEADIIRRRYMADEPETLDDIGRDYGVSREWIRQIESKALAAVREVIASETPEFEL